MSNRCRKEYFIVNTLLRGFNVIERWALTLARPLPVHIYELYILLPTPASFLRSPTYKQTNGAYIKICRKSCSYLSVTQFDVKQILLSIWTSLNRVGILIELHAIHRLHGYWCWLIAIMEREEIAIFSAFASSKYYRLHLNRKVTIGAPFIITFILFKKWLLLPRNGNQNH